MSESGNEKTTFDKVVKVSSAILIPLSIALAGHLFGIQMKYADIQSQEKMHRQDWRITKGELISKFVDDLTSSSEIKRKIAVESILIALPEDGPRIAQKVSNDDPSKEVRKSANNSIENEILKIIKRMFSSEDENTRIESTKEAISGWTNSDKFISMLIQYSLTNIENPNGVWNSVIYLEKNNANHLSRHREEINKLRANLDSIGDRTSTIKRMDNNVISKME